MGDKFSVGVRTCGVLSFLGRPLFREDAGVVDEGKGEEKRSFFDGVGVGTDIGVGVGVVVAVGGGVGGGVSSGTTARPSSSPSPSSS